MSIYDLTIPQFSKMLGNLERWLDKAETYAAGKSFDVAVLLNARLAPDQYPLLRQVQIACDAAKSTAAHLAGREPPKHPDTEQSLSELRARIRTCRAYLETFAPADFEEAATRRIEPPFLPGKWVIGSDYLIEMQLPNFYFHVTTAYAILRHNGVDLGKRDYIGSARFREISETT